MDLLDSILDRGVVVQVPVLIKARPPETNGRRLIDVEVSTETVDLDGDVVFQDALLKAADGFVATGHLDIDHLSEFGTRLGIPNPSSYIIGRPLSVRAEGKSTFVEGEISRSMDGQLDPLHNRFDEFWQSLQRNPPVMWFSSIYGFPTDFDDCSKGACGNTGATRYVIKGIDWRSLAFTRSPKNTALKSAARIITAKAYLVELAKAMPPAVDLPQSMDDVWGAHACPICHVHESPSLLGYREHFAKCRQHPAGVADIMAHATMHKHRMNAALPWPGGPTSTAAM